MAADDERRKQALLRGPIRRVQRRLNLELQARGLVAPIWCAATALALYRFAFRDHVAIAGAVLALGAIAVWVWRTRPALVSIEQAAALTDRSVGAGGLLLTRLELPVGEWELSLNERVRQVRPPEISIRRPVGLTLLALVFAAVALRVPLPPRPTPRVNAAAASRLAQVEAKAEALARERPLGDEAAELARLREELVQGRFDAADWEAADSLSQALEQQAARAAADLSRAEAAAKALEEGLARGMSRDEEAREREALEQALMAVGGAQGAGQRGQDGTGEQGRTGEATASGQPGGEGGAPRSRAEVAELRQALESRQRDLAQAFGQGTGMAERGAGSGRQGAGEGAGTQRQGGGAPHPSRMVRQGEAGQAGGEQTGVGVGVGRGGEAGQLVFGGEARMDPDRLEFSPLPKGNGGEAGELWGLRGADPRPDVEHARGEATGAVAEGERTPGTRAGPLLPRNRELVRRYFESGAR